MQSTEIAHFLQRRLSLQSTLAVKDLLLITSPSDVTYFTGSQTLVPEEREGALFLSKNQAVLAVSSFSPIAKNDDLEIVYGCTPKAIAEHLKKVLVSTTSPVVRFQAENLTVSELRALESEHAGKVQFTELDSRQIETLRQKKDDQEIDALRRAGKLVANGFNQLLPLIKEGMTELQVKDVLEDLFKKLGSEKPAFPTIVAFEKNTTSVHHQPTDKVLRNEMPILIDCGTTVDGYRSDFTRTWWFGKHPTDQFLTIEKVVISAYEAAEQLLSKSQEKIQAKQVDEVARKVITDAGFGPQFIHTTGHGVGLDIHEEPSLSWRGETTLEPGMVVTIEPGIYVANGVGYRHENTILVTDSGAEVLTVQK